MGISKTCIFLHALLGSRTPFLISVNLRNRLSVCEQYPVIEYQCIYLREEGDSV